MSARLLGKVFCVTGSTQGLGRAIVHRLRDEGAAGLVICGRNSERAEKVKAELETESCRVGRSFCFCFLFCVWCVCVYLETTAMLFSSGIIRNHAAMLMKDGVRKGEWWVEG
mmetsp:Transcript_789/g.1685  ORF Transcript_789/g.1685 Transcript_789/m.1685 type:complete len:112 (-) Transcript_789:1311-1646(-)